MNDENKYQLKLFAVTMAFLLVGGIAGYLLRETQSREDCTELCNNFMKENCVSFEEDMPMFELGDWNDGWNDSGMAEKKEGR